MNLLLAFFRLLILSAWLPFLVLCVYLLRLFSPSIVPWFIMQGYGSVLGILGIRRTIIGKVSTHAPTLYVSNHTSYLDILVLGALLPASFIAKSEVKSWPIIGWIATITRTVYATRTVSKTQDNLQKVEERLDKGESLILFPEGTTSDGGRVLTFKSSLFQMVKGREEKLMIQPISIAYREVDGLPSGFFDRPSTAWFGDMELFPHLWQILKRQSLTAEVKLYDPFLANSFSAENGNGLRKQVAEHCEIVISQGLSEK